jgi:dTDP-4-amino-4,6-dideoxygalactose transaminase
MPDWVVPLSDVQFREAEIAAVADTYRSGWISQGPKVAAFESAFASYVGARHAVAVASGTAALQLICAAVGLGSGDEVVLPSLTFAATAAAVVHAGAVPVFADVRGLAQPWLSADAAGAAIGPRTRAIIHVAYAGHPGEVTELRGLADERGLILIEDAAHAVGSWLEDRHAGTFGHAGAFSFFANKNMPLGEGGMAVTDDSELAERMVLLRSHGLTADTWARHRGDAADYDVVEPGFNFRLDEPRAALGMELLERLDSDTALRDALARRYLAAFANSPRLQAALDEQPGVRSAWHIFPLLLSPGTDRAAFRARLRELGVQTSVHYPPLHLTAAYRALARSLPVTESYASRTVTVPLFPHMNEAQQIRVIDAVSAPGG